MSTGIARSPTVVGGGEELATIGGGCFWCLEPIFSELRGVVRVEVGYSGGRTVNPTYEEVCTDTTGHAEVVQVTFNPNEISFKEILQIFFRVHDPTTLNRQGNDVGTQYRSVIFYRDDRQKQVAEEVIREVESAKVWDGPIVTEVKPFTAFYRAEEYHQRYYERNPHKPYCQMVIAPKLIKFRKRFYEKLK